MSADRIKNKSILFDVLQATSSLQGFHRDVPLQFLLSTLSVYNKGILKVTPLSQCF